MSYFTCPCLFMSSLFSIFTITFWWFEFLLLLFLVLLSPTRIIHSLFPQLMSLFLPFFKLLQSLTHTWLSIWYKIQFSCRGLNFDPWEREDFYIDQFAKVRYMFFMLCSFCFLHFLSLFLIEPFAIGERVIHSASDMVKIECEIEKKRKEEITRKKRKREWWMSLQMQFNSIQV